MKSSAASWIAGTVIVSLLLAVATWFLVISPKQDDIDAIKLETTNVKSQNELTEMKIAVLRKQFERLDEYKAALATIQLQIPTTAQLAEYTKEAAAAAEANQVTVMSWNPGVPLSVVPVVSLDPGAEATALPEVPGFVAVPVAMTVVGTYQNSLNFLESLQTGTQRLFLITTLSGTALTDGEASGGRPATAVGDMELAVNGYAYVLADPYGAVQPPVEDGTVPPALPVQPAGKNPLIPVAGD